MRVLSRMLRPLLETRVDVDEAAREAGVRALMVHGVAIMAMIALQGGPFLTAFLMRLGGSNYEVGLLTTFAFASQFMQIPGLMLIQRFPRRRFLTVMSALCYRLCWVGICAVPFALEHRRVEAVLGLLLLAELLSAVSGPAWNSFLRDAVSSETRGRIMARRMALGTGASLAVTLAGGWLVDRLEPGFAADPARAYPLLFGVGVALGFVGIAALVRVPEPSLEVERGARIMDLLRRPFRDANFRRLLAFNASWSLAVNLPAPFFVVYILRRLEVPLGWVTLLVVVSQLANLLFLGAWGRLADRFSNKSVLALSCPLFLVSLSLWPLTTLPGRHALSLPLLFGIYVLSGIAMAGVAVAGTNIALELAPRGDAPAYLTVHGLSGALTGALGPLAGGLLADLASSYELAVLFRFTGTKGAAIHEAFNLQGLDFVFLAGVGLGFLALHRLSFVTEEGEVTETELRAQFLAEVTAPFRGFSPLPGLRSAISSPVSAVFRLARARPRGAARGGGTGAEP